MLNFYSGGDLGVFTVLLGPPVVPGDPVDTQGNAKEKIEKR